MEKVEPDYAIKPNERMHLLVRMGIVQKKLKSLSGFAEMEI